jgi:hypothetical protein
MVLKGQFRNMLITGLMIDESLDWTAHTFDRTHFKGLAILRRLRDTVEFNTLIIIYQSIIQRVMYTTITQDSREPN